MVYFVQPVSQPQSEVTNKNDGTKGLFVPFGRFSDSPMVDVCFEEFLENSGSSTIETKSKGKELPMEIGNQYF